MEYLLIMVPYPEIWVTIKKINTAKDGKASVSINMVLELLDETVILVGNLRNARLGDTATTMTILIRIICNLFKGPLPTKLRWLEEKAKVSITRF